MEQGQTKTPPIGDFPYSLPLDNVNNMEEGGNTAREDNMYGQTLAEEGLSDERWGVSEAPRHTQHALPQQESQQEVGRGGHLSCNHEDGRQGGSLAHGEGIGEKVVDGGSGKQHMMEEGRVEVRPCDALQPLQQDEGRHLSPDEEDTAEVVGVGGHCLAQEDGSDAAPRTASQQKQGKGERAAATMAAWEKKCAQLEQETRHAREHGGLSGLQGGALEGWCKNQRKKREAEQLSADQIGRLDALGFDWGSLEPPRGDPWEARFEELRAYQREHGHCQVPQRGSELGRWLKNQRGRKDRLSAERVARLEGIGFTWTREGGHHHANATSPNAADRPDNDARWEEKREQLRRFAGEHGHFRVPKASHPQLKAWVDKQRHQYKQDKLPASRVARLEALGFDMGTKVTKIQVTLEERLTQLNEYFQQYGDCNVPLSHPILGRWAWDQRSEYKKMRLSDERVKRLEEAGFDWQLSFEERAEQLRLFASRHGHDNPPQNHVVLGGWVKDQRRAYAANELPEDHAAALSALGLVLASPPKMSWEYRFAMLQQYFQQYGDCAVPRSNPQLGCWLDNQRRSYRKGKLAPERVAALNELGVTWGAVRKDLELSWREQYNQLRQYKQEHGDCIIPQAATGLGRFVHWQRCVRRRGKLSKERIALLDEIGFHWGTAVARPNMSWQERFDSLRRYKEQNGHCNVPRDRADLAGLYWWVNKQRCQFKKLSEVQRDLLLEVEVTPAEDMGERWAERCNELRAYKDQLGDVNIRLPNPLGKWCDNQRRYYKQGMLSDERAEQLRDLGFDFDPCAVADFRLCIQSGELGLTLRFDESIVGAEITGIDPTCTFKDRVSVGNRLVTIDGNRVTEEEDLAFNNSQMIGIATKTCRTRKTKKPTEKAAAADEEKKEGEAASHTNNNPDQSAHPSVDLVPRPSCPSSPASDETDKNKKNIHAADATALMPSATVPEAAPPLTEKVTSLKELSSMKSWIAQFTRLEEYALANGNCNMKSKRCSLYEWCVYQRKKYRDGKLSENQIFHLERIGFVWGRPERREKPVSKWESQFSRLKEYIQEHPSSWKNGCNIKPKIRSLDNWLKYNRRKYKAGKLSDDQISRLESLGFQWAIEVQSDQWEAKFEELCAYKKEHGPDQVPEKDSALGRWLNRQRNRKHKLSAPRVARLDEIGFTWTKEGDGSIDNETVWEEKCLELQRFKEETGHFKVSKSAHPQLKVWVARQRQSYKQNKLLDSRASRLKAIGFNLSTKEKHKEDKEENLAKDGKAKVEVSTIATEETAVGEKDHKEDNQEHPVEVTKV